MSEEDNILTFSELRKIQKNEDEKDQITELGDKFLLRASNYFDKKKQAEGENSREYRNAKRVLDKITTLRQEKIVKEARLSVKTEKNNQDIHLLPEEREIFRNLKHEFKTHREKIEDKIESKSIPSASTDTSEDRNTGARGAELEEQEIKEPTPEAGGESQEQEESSPEAGDKDNMEGETNVGKSSQDGYTLVETTSDVPEFMGTDLEAYGPFDKGEEVEIPDDNAEILVNRGNAERVET